MHRTPPHARSGSAVAATHSAFHTELDRGSAASVVALCASLIEYAHALGASDIHLDPTDREVRVRVRIDGALLDLPSFPARLHAETIARLKVLAGLRTDEHYAAQDGRFRHADIDLRVSIVPTYYGENAVVRLLTRGERARSLDALGFTHEHIQSITQALSAPHGMILVTGPTGSGKTTTLYTLINLLADPERSIVTVEDPIEYSLPSVTQIPVHARAGLTFATGLRAILRQDPDVIMVGEIRDKETASLAINAALTGHLVLSTLHTNDAVATLPRLIDMGIDSYLIAATVRLVLAQRLARLICMNCKRAHAPTPEEERYLVHLNARVRKSYRGEGCDACGGTGYHGRIAVGEVLTVDAAVRNAMLARVSGEELARAARIERLAETGLRYVETGSLSLRELMRVTHE